VRRFGQALGLDPARLEEYKQYHANIWPEIAAEYEARMKALAAAPRMREWWDLMEAMQIPDPERGPGTWWSETEEVFHQD
jgi:L-rhamnose mutarotase